MGGTNRIEAAIRSALCVLGAGAAALLLPPPAAEARFLLGPGLAEAFPAPQAPSERKTRRAQGKPYGDSDRDGLSDWVELRRTRTNPRRRDTDGDRLTDWFEVRRARTNPRRRDSDRDGLSDWRELRRTKTNPRRADSDGDGARDGKEVGAGTDPRDPRSSPGSLAAPPALGSATTPDTVSPPPADEEKTEPPPPPPPPDTTPPAVQVVSGPDGLTNDPSPTFGFDAEAGAEVECSLDAGAPDFGPCSGAESHAPAAPLPDGAHTFRVRATDAAGNQAVATRGFTVDATAPETQIDSGPPALTNSAAAQLAFSGADGDGSGIASFQCRLDSDLAAAWAACESPQGYADLDDGEHSFDVRAVDLAGNVDQTPGSHEWTVDADAPSAPQLEATVPPSPANDNTPKVVGSAPVGATVRLYSGAGCDGAELVVATPAELEAGVEVTVADDSVTVFRATATSPAANTSACSEPLTYAEDSTAPRAEITVAPPPLTSDADARFEFDGDDGSGSGVASFQCKLDDGAFDACGSGIELSDLAESVHRFAVRAIDQASNVGSAVSHEWAIDRTAPAIAIDHGPDGLTNDPSPIFEFSAEAGAEVECSIDAGTADFGPCSGAESHAPATPLPDGAHTFRVRATDAAGNQAVATRGFTVDATAPETQIDSGPPPLTNSPVAELAFSATDGGSGVAFFRCRIDSGEPDAWLPCTTPHTKTALSAGNHKFEVRAIDNAGNVDGTPASREWTVDTAPPAVQVTHGPDGLTNDPSPIFEFSAEAGAEVECSIDAGAPDFGPCSGAESHAPATPLPDGAHTFRVRATDAAGNQAVATRDFEVDTALPPAPLLSATEPGSPANHNQPLVLGEAEAGTTVRLYAGGCSGSPLASVGVAELEAGIEVSVPDDSSTSFRATATTPAGNTSGCSEPLVYVEDSTAPETQIDAGPPALTNSAAAQLAFSGTDGGGSGVASFECRIDSGAWGGCQSPHQLSDLADGEHRFEVRATDQAGNVDPTPASHQWTVDTAPPAVQVTHGPEGLTNDPSPEFGFSAEAGASVECSIDAGTADFGPCSAAGSHTPAEPLADGAHTFRVLARDAAGNQAVATRGFTVDATPPETQIDSGPAALTNTVAAELIFSGADAGSGVASFECRIDSGEPDAWTPCTGPHTETGLSEGNHKFDVRAIDNAGNVDGAPAVHEWTVDSIAPGTQIDQNPPALVNADTAAFAFSGSDPGGSGVASFECRLDDEGSFQACTSGIELSGLSEGAHRYEVRAVDHAGNVDGTPASHEWTIDLTPPSVSVEGGPEGLTGDATPTFAFGSEPSASLECSIDAGAPDFGACSAADSHIPAEPLADGARTFRVRATDAAGNQAVATRGFTVDATAPETQIDSGPPPLTNSPVAELAFSATDGGSGVAFFRCRIDSGEPDAWLPCTTPHTKTALSAGNHKFEVRAIDNAGNVDGTPASREWTVDTAPPAVQVTHGPDGLTNDPSPIFEFSAEAGAEVECSIDAGAPDFGPCSGAESHAPATPLPDGAHTFRVRATDAAGNQAVATRDFEVDTALPPAPLLSATEPGSPANHNQPLVLGEAEAGTTVRLYAGGCLGSPLATVGVAELEAGIEVSVPDDSSTSFRATATTPADNTSGCSEPLVYVEDSTAPETQIDAGPPALTNSAAAQLAFSGTDGGGSGVASFECRIDSGAWGGCQSPHQLSDLADGEHSFEVRATDQAGNVDQAPGSHEWTVDATPPGVTIDAVSSALLKAGQSSQLTWRADEVGAYELRVGGASCDTGTAIDSGAYAEPPAPRSSTVSAAQLSEGANGVRLCLTDAAGNRGTAATTIVRDTTSPQAQITLEPPAQSNSTAADFEFTGSDPGGSGLNGFECRLDEGAWSACSSPRRHDGLGEGPHTFDVRSVDNAGNRDQSPASVAWQVDLTPPVVGIVAGPDGLTSNATPTFRFETEPGATAECSIAAGPPSFGSCSTSSSHTPASDLAEGAHAFHVRVADAAGNQATASRSFAVDTTAPPEPVLSATVPGSPANENAPLLFGSAPAGSTVQLFANSCTGAPLATFSQATLEAGVAIPVEDDSATSFRASATVGERTSGCSEPLFYVEDSSPPQTTIASPPPSGTLSTSATFFPQSSDPGSSFECSLDGSAFAACESSISYADLPPGAHSFAARATDPAGNPDPSPAEWAWTIDPPPPAPPSACDEGAAQAATAAAVRAAVQAGSHVCVTAALGDVDLSDLGARPVVVSTAAGAGSMRDVDLASTTDLTISRARFRSIELRESHRTMLLGNTIGGTPESRVADQLIFMPSASRDVAIEGNDIGWTIADESGNTGYGCRCYGDLDRLRFVGNRLHDLAADGFQGVGGVDVLIDRNEIGPVGRNPESNEHSDNIQITGNEANLRITNNWIHHQGYYGGAVTANAGSTYIHGGSSGSLLYENNLIETAQGRTEICGLGTGGTSRSNITIRRNTWVDGGLAFNGFPGFEWDCDSGAGNTITRNIAVDPDGGLADNGYDAAFLAPNIFDTPSAVTLDADGNCTSASCNPPGEEPIGYRKPAGVSW